MPAPKQQEQQQVKWPFYFKYKNLQLMEMHPAGMRNRKKDNEVVKETVYRAFFKSTQGESFNLLMSQDKALLIAELAGRLNEFNEKNNLVKINLQGQPEFKLMTYGTFDSRVNSWNPEVRKKFNNTAVDPVVQTIHSVSPSAIDNFKFLNDDKSESMAQINVNLFKKADHQLCQNGNMRITGTVSSKRSNSEIQWLTEHRAEFPELADDQKFKNAQYRTLKVSLFMPEDEYKKLEFNPEKAFGEKNTFYSINIPKNEFNITNDPQYGLQMKVNVTADNFAKRLAVDTEPKHTVEQTQKSAAQASTTEMPAPPQAQENYQMQPGM